MKVTIYELLGMIKDGKTPKKIKCFNYNFIYTGDKRPQRFYKLVNQDNYLLRDFVYTLNTEVEIIEEPQEHKIPEKLDKYYDKDLEEYVVETYIKGVNYKEIFKSRYDEMIISKINEILDYLEEIK